MRWSKVEEYKKRNKWKNPLLGVIGAAVFAMSASYTVKAEEIVDQDEVVISDTVGIVEDEGTSFIETEETEETLETPERVEKPDAEAVEDNTEDLNSQVKEENTIEKGWVSENGSKYYLDENGERCTGWLLQDEGWYYLDAEKDGAMFDAGWKYINSKWYHFYDSGVMETGWTYYKNNWYYLSPYGDMLVNEWDYINSNWYHFDQNGIMQTGWFLYDGNWYYLYPANNNAGKSVGVMAQNTTIDGYFISQDGIWINDEAYQGAYNVLNQVGWDLWSAYSWSASLPYVNYSNDPSPGSKNFAIHGFQTKTGDCYVMAATFYYMAKALGYDAHQMAGYVPLRGGGLGVHSWVEIDMDGSTYVFDPDFTHEAKRNGYQITYGMSGTWRYSNYYRMN